MKRTRLFWLIVPSWLAGCSLIVSGEVPTFRCSGAEPTSCPSGTICDPATSTCVTESSGSDAHEDPPGDDDGGPDRIVGDADAGPSPLGGECVVDGDCAEGLVCGTSTNLTTAIVPMNSKPVCTHPCCTSADCADGFVCFSTGTGGDYCVEASRADRAPPKAGGKSGGQRCSADDECRSGVCAGRCKDAPHIACRKNEECESETCEGQRRCLDACCQANASTCAAGSTCRILTVATHVAWACGTPNPPPAKDLDASCNTTSECKNDNCIGFGPNRKCTPPCCKSADCRALGFADEICAYGSAGNDQLKWCLAPNPTGADLGEDCNSNTDCKTRYCDGELRKCANVCCTDDDCSEDEACRPSASGLPFLRCVKRS